MPKTPSHPPSTPRPGHKQPPPTRPANQETHEPGPPGVDVAPDPMLHAHADGRSYPGCADCDAKAAVIGRG